jgi:hypothetical protein
MFFDTNATQYAEVGGFDAVGLDGGFSRLYQTFAPAVAVPVPKPSTCVLMGLGLAA